MTNRELNEEDVKYDFTSFFYCYAYDKKMSDGHFLVDFTIISIRMISVALGGMKMSDMTRVALDAMGGDNAPVEMVKGAVEAVQKRNDIQVLLTGKEEILKEELAKYTYPDEKIHIVNATEVIETAEPPVKAIRSKKDSSLVTAMKLVRNGEADAFVSAGNSGAVLVGGQLLVGKIKGVERPPLAPLIPTLKGVSLLIDCGANVDARPSHLVQFAKMGSIYMESVVGKKNPTVGIEYRRGRRERECPCERDVSASERVS